MSVWVVLFGIYSITRWNKHSVECVASVFQLRTAMVKGETGTLSLDVKTSVDKGVSSFLPVGVLLSFLILSIFCTSFKYELFLSAFFLALTETSDVLKKWLLLHRHQWDTIQVCLMSFNSFCQYLKGFIHLIQQSIASTCIEEVTRVTSAWFILLLA